MGFALLLIESLAWSLLLVATILACVGRLCRGWLLLALGLPVPLVLLLIHVGLTAFAAYYQFNVPISNWFYPTLNLAIFFLIGTVWLLIRGLRRTDAEGTAVAAAWPRGKLAIALAAAVALYCMTFWNLDLAARQQLAAIRVEAGALALSVAPPRVPNRDNAAFVYQHAFEAMGRVSQEDDLVPGAWQWDESWRRAWDEKWTEWQTTGKIDFDLHDAELRRFLARQAPTLRLLRQAAKMPDCYFERDYGRPSIAMLLPELSPLRQGGRLLALDAICAASDGNYRQSIEDINAMFLMAEHVGSNPLLISELVSIAVDCVAIQTLQAVLANYHVPAGELAALRIPDNVAYRVLLQRALRFEEALRLATFDNVGSGGMEFSELIRGGRSGWLVDLPLTSAFRVFLLGDDLATHREVTADMDHIARLPFWQAKDRSQQLDYRIRYYPGGPLTAMLTPALTKIMETTTTADARRGVARLGLALYAYRARNGRFPVKLDDLAPEFIAAAPPDPFDGKPMRLRRTDAGLTVYSVGPDMTDNGGIPLDKENKGDITFTVPDVGKGPK